VALTELRLRHGAMDKQSENFNTGTRASEKKFEIRRNAERFNNAQLYAMYKGFHHAQGTALAMRVMRREKAAQAAASTPSKPTYVACG
jgi:uncharacterized protein with WD repeat